MKRNPFAEDTTVSFPVALRIRVVSIEDGRVSLAQEFTDDRGHSVTLRTEIGLRAGDSMLLSNLNVTMSIEQEQS